MFKVEKSDRVLGKFNLTCYYYIHEANMHTFLYSIANKTLEEMEYYLQGYIGDDTFEDVKSVLLLTSNPAYVSDQGIVSAVA